MPGPNPPSVERVHVFIDGSNLYKGAQTCLNTPAGGQPPATRLPPISFPPEVVIKLAEHLCGARRLVKIMYYNSPLNRNDPGYSGQQRFFDGLRKTRYLELRFGRLKMRTIKIYCPTCDDLYDQATCVKGSHNFPLQKYTDKGTDVNIATDLLIQAFDDSYDTAILISEDGDFVGAIQEVRRLRKRVENAFFRRRALASASNAFTLLEPALLKTLGIS